MSKERFSESTRSKILELAQNASGRKSKKRPQEDYSSPSSPCPVVPSSITLAASLQATPVNGNGKGSALNISNIPSITLDDLGGLEHERSLLEELVSFPLQRPEIFANLGADPTCGILLHGVPGSGKTSLGKALAGSLKVPMFYISAPEVVSGVSGESEAQLRTLFATAIDAAPSIIFVDEIDAIAGRRDEVQKDMSRRIVSQLLTCMDNLTVAWREQRKVVIVLGATSRIESIDPALRRAGRFDRELGLAIPSQKCREDILKIICRPLRISDNVNYAELAQKTPGYVSADLHALTKEATILTIRRILTEGTPADSIPSITMEDMINAVKRVQPSAMREGFTVVPNVNWEDVGALDDIRAELIMCIVKPIKHPEIFRQLGVAQSMGVLLYGPPGCGKTLLAKAVAREAGANFISVKGPELLNKYVGESERSIRSLFGRARASSPCVLFFDELDALAPRRGSDGSNTSSERVVNQLLTEMDGMDARDVLGVYVIGATNRPDMIDPALVRPGRLDKVLLVPIPNAVQRFDILRALARKVPLDPVVDLKTLASDARCEGLTGADLASLLRESALRALKDSFVEGNSPVREISQHHVEAALSSIRASVSKRDTTMYEFRQ
jgi:ribosome biogenesis ATPase